MRYDDNTGQKEIILEKRLEQTKPVFIVKQYKKLLTALLAVELVVFLVSLTDTLVAANMIGQEALVAVGLMSHFQFMAIFLSSVINSGTMLNFTRDIGRFDRKHANETFSLGCIEAVIIGILYVAVMIMLKGYFLDSFVLSAKSRGYLEDYYNIIIWYYLLLPLCTVLDNTIMNDGGEKLSSLANIVQTVSNVLLSLFLSRYFGVKGIAFATVLCQILAMLLVCIHFVKKSTMVRFVPVFSVRSMLALLRDGLGRSFVYLTSAVMVGLMNDYINSTFGNDSTAIFVVVKKILDFSLVFMGLATALQPFIGTLRDEKNSKAERYLMKETWRIMLTGGIIASIALMAAAPFYASLFGLDAELYGAAPVIAIRIVGSTLFIGAVLMLLFIYYYITDMRIPMLLITILNNLLVPVTLAYLGVALTRREESIWTGIALSQIVTLIVVMIYIIVVYGRDNFPFVIPKYDEDKIYIYDFPISPENNMAMAETVGEVFEENGYLKSKAREAELIIEEILMYISEINKDQKKIPDAECTIIMEDAGASLIIRDSGLVNDITDADEKLHSFRHYIIQRIMVIPKYSRYVTSTGYNRSLFYFAKEGGEEV